MPKKTFDKDRYKEENKNYDISFLSGAFLRGMAFGKNVTKFSGSPAVMSIDDKEDILLAVKKAYGDMSPRTFKKDAAWWENEENVKKGKKERTQDKENAWRKEKEAVFKWLRDEFYDHFHRPSGDLDQWHKRVCQGFLTKFQKVLSDHGYDGEASLKYGKAQKIVNMTFKYLLCFDDAQTYIGKFNGCHMPIDRYILQWYHDVSPTPCKTAWSELSEGEYDAIQAEIKRILKGYEPLLAEFYIWAEYRSEEADRPDEATH